MEGVTVRQNSLLPTLNRGEVFANEILKNDIIPSMSKEYASYIEDSKFIKVNSYIRITTENLYIDLHPESKLGFYNKNERLEFKCANSFEVGEILVFSPKLAVAESSKEIVYYDI